MRATSTKPPLAGKRSRKSKTRVRAQRRAEVFEMIATGEPLPRTLEALIRLVESEVDELHGSVLLKGSDGKHLAFCAGPSLPADFNLRLGHVAIGPQGGCCGTAAWRGEPVFVGDMQTSELCIGYRELARVYGLRSCWSTPIFTAEGEVAATFALYSQTVREPTAEEMELVATATHIASIALERSRAEQLNRELARTDWLTGLPNRRHFNEHLAELVESSRRTSSSFALALLDLDGFKGINDAFGHNAGDLLLKTVAARLMVAFPDIGIFRLGGDEFTLLIPVEEGEPIEERLQSIIDLMREPVKLEGYERLNSASMGVALFPHHATEADELMRKADIALYRAKSAGRDRFEFYTPAMAASVIANSEFRHEAARAIEADEFLLYYQPVVDIRGMQPRLAGFEALLRWEHPQRGLLTPHHFSAIFDDATLSFDIGALVSSTAIGQMAAWRRRGLDFRAMAINVTTANFSSSRFVNAVLEGLALTELAPQHLCIEVTEGMFLGRGSERTLDCLERLHRAGIRIALDDFGTGFACLTNLRSMPIDHIKIDRSFITGIETDRANRAIVEGLVGIAHSLDLLVVAEGVEERSQLHEAQRLGCDLIQGYLMGRPMHPSQVPAFALEFEQNWPSSRKIA
jgi:diguanylate cyclase (GGDEF)-like protein